MNWQFNKIIEDWQDIAEKYRVKVSIVNGQEEECIILKFQDKPTENEIIAETQKYCSILNEPPDELKEEIKFTE